MFDHCKVVSHRPQKIEIQVPETDVCRPEDEAIPKTKCQKRPEFPLEYLEKIMIIVSKKTKRRIN